MKNFKKNVDGITLIALVITIIVLLILAGVTIAMLTGENGILGRAGQASETTKDVSEDEQVKLAVADALVNGTGTLSTDNLETSLKSEFGEDKLTDTTFTGTGPWTFKGERKTYTIETNGKVTSGDTTTPPTEEKLAKDVLQVRPGESEDYKKSPYVQYSNILCRVLYAEDYSDGSRGLQLVSDDSVTSVSLGKDESAWDSVSRSDYNNAIETLNGKVRGFAKGDGIAVDVRCLGSKATLNGGAFVNDSDGAGWYVSNGSDFREFDNQFKAGDDNYKDDADPESGQLKKLGLISKTEVWLASRAVSEYSSELIFDVRTSGNGSVCGSRTLCYLHAFAGNCMYSKKCGVRPVFLLSPDVKVKSGGNGTESNPYELEL